MEIKKVVATFILTGLLFTGSNYYYTNEIKEKEDEITQLEKSQGLRDSEIARLEDNVKDKNKEINQLDSKLNESLEKVEKQKSTINKQKETIEEQDEEIEELEKRPKVVEKVVYKDRIVSQKESSDSNFKKEKEGSDVGGRKLNVTMTAYTATCKGCSGITATGYDVRNTTTYQGKRIIATDPSVIPLYSIVQVDVNGQSFRAIALDTGGGINGHEIDYLVGSNSEAVSFGRQQGTVTIIREGK